MTNMTIPRLVTWLPVGHPGILGVSRDDKFDSNVPRDMDLILCTRFTEIFIQVDPTAGQVLDISNVVSSVATA